MSAPATRPEPTAEECAAADGRYTIEEAECLGLCDMAPCMLVVDSDRYGNLTPESAVKHLEERS